MNNCSLRIAYHKAYLGDAEFGPKLEAHLRQANVVTTLDDLYVLIQSAQGLAHDELLRQMDKKREWLQCYQSRNPTCVNGLTEQNILAEINYFEEEVSKYQDAMTGVNQTQIQAVRVDNKVTRIDILNGDLLPLFSHHRDILVVPGAVSASIALDSISASAEAIALKTGTELNTLHNQLKKALNGIQNGSVEDQNDVQRAYRDALKYFKQTIQGTF